MRRFTPLNVAAALVVTALVAALVAAGSGAGAATQTHAAAGTAGAFGQALATKLGDQLHKPAADVLAALQSARPRHGAHRLTARAHRLTIRAKRLTARAGRLSARAKHAGKRAKRLAARSTRLAARAKRLTKRADTLRARGAASPAAGATRPERAIARRNAWAAAVAQPLGVTPEKVTAALRALVAERLDSLVRDGWLSEQRRDAELACFDDASRCAGLRPPGLRTLRAGLQ